MKQIEQRIKKLFMAKGLKRTPQRCAIYEMLTGRTDHPTAEDIYRTVKRTFPMISQNTVYYTLSTLQEAGLISEVNFGHEHARFDANMDRHHHLVCVSCQEINDLYDGTLDRLSMSSKKGRQYTILGHRVEFYGYCKRCQEKSKSSSRSEGRNRRTV
ncbi:MAG: transcriptional repressor [Nitrospirae bacterium]|nr:MAG: transcriptional repressor [Nitrospirota bacterium]